MKLTTLALAFGPGALAIAIPVALEPAWLDDFGIVACITLGSVLGVCAAIAANILEPHS
jgi:hypothetical protein